ncbi:MAG TPA: peptide chain release factor-like protein [Longimicrobiales bacterium]|nr:peptide chain release factor-like protein [Longimicrobiales bacterium]
MSDDSAAQHLHIPEDDEALLAQCRVETFRSGGPGGQHQNVTESGVRLVHLPTGIRVTAREERSQHRNRTVALRRLRGKLEELASEQKPRIPTRVPRGQKEKRLEEKRHKGRTKKLRRPPGLDED